MMTIYEINRKNSKPEETKILLTAKAHKDATNITKVVAQPIGKAVSNFLETPKNGHKPKNIAKTKLFANTAPMKI